VYEAYQRVAERTDADPLSYNRVQRLLNEQAFLGITESEYTGGGPGEGSYRIHDSCGMPMSSSRRSTDSEVILRFLRQLRFAVEHGKQADNQQR
jgi:Cdc6-like AAA superfamily ATPase